MRNKGYDFAGRKRKKRLLAAGAAAGVIAAAVAGVLGFQHWKRLQTYDQASALFAQEEYTQAEAVYEQLGSFRDSAEMVQACRDLTKQRLEEALADAMAAENFPAAESAMEQLGYSKDQIAEVFQGHGYEKAVALFESGDWETAWGEFEKISAFRDASDWIAKCAAKKAELQWQAQLETALAESDMTLAEQCMKELHYSEEEIASVLLGLKIAQASPYSFQSKEGEAVYARITCIEPLWPIAEPHLQKKGEWLANGGEVTSILCVCRCEEKDENNRDLPKQMFYTIVSLDVYQKYFDATAAYSSMQVQVDHKYQQFHDFLGEPHIQIHADVYGQMESTAPISKCLPYGFAPRLLFRVTEAKMAE